MMVVITNITYLWSRFKTAPLIFHLTFAFLIRLLFIIYGFYHDATSVIKYTDVDYTVFTDASRHLLKGNSPYEKHTYRYSPLIALLLLPNVTVHILYGKFLFSVLDLLVAVLIRTIVKNNLFDYSLYKSNLVVLKDRKELKIEQNNFLDHAANVSMFTWLYNPLVITISTRGNCDSLAGLLILSVLYFLQCRKQYFISGVIYGLTVHLRLYPIIYCLTVYMYLSSFSTYSDKSLKIKKINIQNAIEYVKSVDVKSTLRLNACSKIVKVMWLFIPNVVQIKFVLGTVLSFVVLTSVFYYLFGSVFLYETYLYHFIRHDAKHNFSLFFYLQYITTGIKNLSVWHKILINLPKLTLLLVFSVYYGLNRFAINFSFLILTVIMVIYNTVITSQYFVWTMALLPLCFWQITMTKKEISFFALVWTLSQFTWLLPAYFLEFQGINTFIFVWIQCVSFFCANVIVLGGFVKHFCLAKEKTH